MTAATFPSSLGGSKTFQQTPKEPPPDEPAQPRPGRNHTCRPTIATTRVFRRVMVRHPKNRQSIFRVDKGLFASDMLRAGAGSRNGCYRLFHPQFRRKVQVEGGGLLKTGGFSRGGSQQTRCRRTGYSAGMRVWPGLFPEILDALARRVLGRQGTDVTGGESAVGPMRTPFSGAPS